jgi:hypothetical protein
VREEPAGRLCGGMMPTLGSFGFRFIVRFCSGSARLPQSHQYNGVTRQWRRVETAAQFHRLEQIDGPYAVEGDVLDDAGAQWVWCVVEGPPEQPRVASNLYYSCEHAMREADRMASGLASHPNQQIFASS